MVVYTESQELQDVGMFELTHEFGLPQKVHSVLLRGTFSQGLDGNPGHLLGKEVLF